MALLRSPIRRRSFMAVGVAGFGLNLVDYLAIRKAGVPFEGVGRSLEAGITHEREFVRFWKTQLKA